MRKPQTWRDKGLLEDEPFLSAFAARQISDPPTRRCAGKDDDASRNATVVKDIKEDMNLLNIVQSWLDFAFRVDDPKISRVEVDERTLNLFVEFYWALSQDDKLATGILEKEHKRRGRVYVLPDIRTQQGSTVDLLKVKKADTKQKRIRNNLIDEKTTARHQQYSNKTDISNDTLRGQSPPKEAEVGSIPAGLQFNKFLKAKKDRPCPERQAQNCLNPTFGLSEAQDPGQIGFNSPHSQNTAAIYDSHKTRKRRQTTPDTRRVKHQRINGTALDTSSASDAPISIPVANTSIKLDNQGANTYDSQRGLEVHPAKGKQPILRAVTKKAPIPRPRPKEVNTELPHVSNDQPFEQRTNSRTRVDSPQKRLKRQKNHLSGLGRRREHLSQGNPPSLNPSQPDTQVPVFPSRGITPATHNSSNRGKCAATSRATHRAKGRQGPRQTNEVVVNKVICTNNVPDGPTSDQILNKIKKPGQYSGMHFPRISKLKTSQETEEKSQQDGPLLNSRNNEPPGGQGTFVPIDGSALPSSTNQHNTLAIDTPSNPRKRLPSNFDTLALEGENYATAPKETSIREAERATVTRREKKRPKIVQEQDATEPVKDGTTVVPVHKQFRGGNRMRTEQRGPLKVESSERPLIQIETHTATGRPPANESLFHEPQRDGTPSNSKRHASSLEDHQPKRQEIAIDQKNFVPITVQPEPVEERRIPSPKTQIFGQDGSVSMTVSHAPVKRRGRPPKPKVLSSTPIQLNAGMAVPSFGQNVGIKQEPTYIHVPRSAGTLEGHLCRNNILRSELDRDVKEESIRSSENWLLAQEHSLVVDHPSDIPPTHKPPLGVKPPIWAQSRQEVCETFDWFRSYQGGVYFAQNIVKGYLLSAFSSKRDRFEHGGRLIISHGGGKAESFHTRKGQTMAQPATDQLAQDKSVRALLDNYRNQRPLVLLIDDKYVLFPYDLGARDMTYVVLGFYTIVHAWAEYQPANNETGRVVRYKFAFRWCDDQGSPWWITNKETYLSDLTPPSTSRNFVPEPASKRRPTKKSKNIQGAVLCATSSEPKSFLCMSCHMASPRIYTWSWACLHPSCSRFWKTNQGNFLPNNLEYDSDFLKLMTSLPIPPDFGKLKPDPPPYLSTDITITNYACTRGFHCKSCGRLSCRFKWEKWECMNCGECLEVSVSVYKAKDFWSTLLPIGYKDHSIGKVSKIDQQPVRGFRHENGMGTIQSFILPDGRGKIHHIQPGTPLGRLEADEIFIEYQQQAAVGVLRFRRWPLRSHKCRGALLSNYFSQNSGEPYQYVGGSANTVPFENAPGAVVKARALIQKRIRQALGIHVDFNEVLSAAYMERQRMAFHSDNEIGLGPTVAGLSLGSPALMHFRIHAKHDPLREQKGNLLSFVLRHGDVLVMDGAGVQEYYEHTVIPNNFRIAATARQIGSEHA